MIGGVYVVVVRLLSCWVSLVELVVVDCVDVEVF